MRCAGASRFLGTCIGGRNRRYFIALLVVGCVCVLPAYHTSTLVTHTHALLLQLPGVGVHKCHVLLRRCDADADTRRGRQRLCFAVFVSLALRLHTRVVVDSLIAHWQPWLAEAHSGCSKLVLGCCCTVASAALHHAGDPCVKRCKWRPKCRDMSPSLSSDVLVVAHAGRHLLLCVV